MSDVTKFNSFLNKAKEANQQFQFLETAQFLQNAESELKKIGSQTDYLQEVLSYTDTPAPVSWINDKRKDPSVVAKIDDLLKDLNCDCDPFECECIPTSEIVNSPNLRCKLCDEKIASSNDAVWVDAKSYTICECCNDILFDKLYPARTASMKLDEVISNIHWYCMGDRIQFPTAYALLTEAQSWAKEADTFHHKAT